jgi:hypothetical protein
LCCLLGLVCLGLGFVSVLDLVLSWPCHVMSCLDLGLGLGLGLGPVLSWSCLGLGLGLVLSCLGLVMP